MEKENVSYQKHCDLISLQCVFP